MFQGLVVLILKFYLEQILKTGRINSRFILMQNKHWKSYSLDSSTFPASFPR